MNPYIYGHLIFKKVLRHSNGEDNNFSTNGAGMTGEPHAKEGSFLILTI